MTKSTPLEELSKSEEDSSNASDGVDTVGGGSTRAGGAGAGAGVGAGAGAASSGGSLGVGAVARPLALDLLLEVGLELAAAEVTAGGLDVESTSDTLEGTELKPRIS